MLSFRFFVFAFLLVLVGCHEPRVVLPGHRVPILFSEGDLQVDSVYAQASMKLPSQFVLNNWHHIHDDDVFSVHGFDLERPPKMRWRRAVQGHIPPVVRGDSLFLLNTQSQVMCLDIENGRVRWSQSILDALYREGNGTRGGLALDHAGHVYAATGQGDVVALQGDDGKILWRYEGIDPICVAPTVYGGRVFVVTVSNKLIVLSATTGDVLWFHQGLPETTRVEGGGAPWVGDQAVVVAYTSGEVWALHPDNGTPLWSDILISDQFGESIADISHVVAAPRVSQGYVFLLSHGGCMRALHLKDGTKQWSLKVSSLQTPSLWQDSLAFITQDGYSVCLDQHTGRVRWLTPLLTKMTPSTRRGWMGPFITKSGLLCVSSQGQMVWLDPSSGHLEEGIVHGGGFRSRPVIAQGRVFVMDKAGVLTVW